MGVSEAKPLLSCAGERWAHFDFLSHIMNHFFPHNYLNNLSQDILVFISANLDCSLFKAQTVSQVRDTNTVLATAVPDAKNVNPICLSTLLTPLQKVTSPSRSPSRAALGVLSIPALSEWSYVRMIVKPITLSIEPNRLLWKNSIVETECSSRYKEGAAPGDHGRGVCVCGWKVGAVKLTADIAEYYRYRRNEEKKKATPMNSQRESAVLLGIWSNSLCASTSLRTA